MFNYMADITAEYGYPFLNLNREYETLRIVFEEDFADYGSHTNAVGAQKCTRFLENYLEEHYAFEDRRGQSGYQSWDEAYLLWQEKLESARTTIADHIAREDYAEREE